MSRRKTGTLTSVGGEKAGGRHHVTLEREEYQGSDAQHGRTQEAARISFSTARFRHAHSWVFLVPERTVELAQQYLPTHELTVRYGMYQHRVLVHAVCLVRILVIALKPGRFLP